MMAELINRKQMKHTVREQLKSAQVSPKAMVALYSCLVLMLNLLTFIGSSNNVFSIFVSVLTALLVLVLESGFVLYCMSVRRGERAEFLTLFDGFSFAGKIIALNIVMYFFILLWSMLFLFPGIVAAYRYRFARYNLYENPGISVMEAISMSKRQTVGYKFQLFTLDLSYIGWTFLASLPVSVESTFVMQNSLPYVANFTIPTFSAPMEGWLITLIAGIWSLIIGLFYLANYQCVELGYFETAKRTSGVYVTPPQNASSDETNQSNSF